MRKLKVLCMCSCGLGSSIMLKTNLESLLKSKGIECNIEVSDTSGGKGLANSVDLILISSDLRAVLDDRCKTPIIYMTNLVSKKELEEKVNNFLDLKMSENN
jgi:PTS system ascorbate-specific IIB component